MRRAAVVSTATKLLPALLALHAAWASAQDSSPETLKVSEQHAYPVDLPTVLRLAGAQNLDVQLAHTAVEEAHANYASAWERFFPTLVPTASYLRHSGRDQAVDGTVVNVTKHSETAGVGVYGQIPVGEAIFQALQGRQLIEAADAAAVAQGQDSSLLAAQQYFDLVSTRALVEVVTESLAISENYEHQLNEAVQIGIVFKGDAVRVQTQTQRLRVDLSRAQQQQRLASARLTQTLHLDPLVELTPAEREPQPLALADLTATPQMLIQSALQNRPELARSGALIHAAQDAHRGALYGPLVPTLGAQAFAGRFDGGPGDTDANGGARRDYSVGLSWRVGPGGLFDFGRIRAADTRVATAQITDEKLRDDIARQVVEGYTRVQSLFEQVHTAQLNLSSAQETLRLTRGRKQFGVGVVLEDIQAQQELQRARSDLVNIITELNQQQYGLLRSVGAPLRQSRKPAD